MVRLVDDLLDISRMTKGKLRLTTERVDLRVAMNRAADSARPLLASRRHGPYTLASDATSGCACRVSSPLSPVRMR